MLSELLQQISSRGLRTLLCAWRWQVRFPILFLPFFFFFCTFFHAGLSLNLPCRSIEFSENAHSMAASSLHSRLLSSVSSTEAARPV